MKYRLVNNVELIYLCRSNKTPCITCNRSNM